MQLLAVQRVLGLLLMMFSVTMLLPIPISLIFSDGQVLAFLIGFAVNIATGFAMWMPVRNNRSELRLRDGFLVVVGFWVVLGGFGCVPFIVSTVEPLGFTDAIFESMSGLTTTGATVISNLYDVPKSILFYRQQLQWFGGMGIIVLAVAILPMLGVGGMQLYKAETPGPMKDSKLTPRITETAKALWVIYLGLTIACAVSFFISGMDWFDAICHSFSTVAIGGFSPYDDSMTGFGYEAKIVCIVFMVLAGMNFALHFMSFRNYRASTYFEDAEWRTYMKILAILSLITVVVSLGWVWLTKAPDETINYLNGVIDGVFQAVSFATTTGFTTTNHSEYPLLLPMLLVSASFIGGCAGSTGGGMKVVRVLLLAKQGTREIKRLIHPNAQLPVKLGDRTMSERVVESVWGFFSIYIALFGIMFLAMITILSIDATLLENTKPQNVAEVVIANEGATGNSMSASTDSSALPAALDSTPAAARPSLEDLKNERDKNELAADSIIVTAFSAVAACLNNLGPGLGGVASNFQSVPDVGKWILVFAMLLGRLEIFTLLALLTPAFWRK